MAKINHPKFNESVNELLTEAKEQDIILLTSENSSWEGDVIKINDRDLINFGTCGYLGLETHPKLIEGSIDFTRKFGTQYSISRTYVISDKSKLLESNLSAIFNHKKVLTYTSTSLAHISVLPLVVGLNDLVILDQQVHISIQTATQLLAAKGIKIEMIRHNSLDMLEHKIQETYNSYDRIWYMVDGVYSMFGDVAPIEKINALLKKYNKLHLYVDDAHGMSWYGTHGCGRTFEACDTNGKTIYVSTMAKAFGVMGGIVVFPTSYWYEKVYMHGGPLAYSHPIPPPIMGAAIASAEIHLSEEIIKLQHELKDKINFTQQELLKTDLPIISSPETPIFYIGTGKPSVGYNLVRRMMSEGFYVNLAMFPVVPLKNTGLRFTINNHLSKSQIQSFLQAMEYHYPFALEEEDTTLAEVRRAFKLVQKDPEKAIEKKGDLKIKVVHTIKDFKKDLWNSYFAGKGNLDWDSLQLLENAYKGNELSEHNWNFYYVTITDALDKIVLITFFTSGLYKDDMLSPPNISMKVEEKRLDNPYYLVSKTLSMGSLFTEGEHLYINKDHTNHLSALKMLVDWTMKVQEETICNSIIYRDFKESDQLISAVLFKEGFFKLQMPNSNQIDNLPSTIEEHIERLNAKNKKHFRKDVFEDLDKVEFKFQSVLNEEELNKFYELYKNVAGRNFSLNIFEYPFKLFKEINGAENWEFIVSKVNGQIVSIGCCYKGVGTYSPVILGLNYEANLAYKIYKKVLFKVIERAIQLKCKKIFLGLSADLEKRKLGAESHSSCAYIFIKDNFNYELLNLSNYN